MGEAAPMRGYACLVLRRHAVELHDLTEPEGAAFMRDARRLSAAVAAATGAAKLNYEIHGNTIPHLHLHVYPRYPGDPFEGRPIDPRAVAGPVYAPGEFAAVRTRTLDALRRMRKQYFFRPSPEGLLAWDVDRLVRLSRELPVRAVPLAEIRELDGPVFGDEEPPTWRSFVAHVRLLEAAELVYPIILAADGTVMDGMHRVAKAHRDGRAFVEAVQFAQDPPPDHVGRHPDELPY
jgi:diadenosine tetraphosphate (Ap4A) HIT family hydrolase